MDPKFKRSKTDGGAADGLSETDDGISSPYLPG